MFSVSLYKLNLSLNTFTKYEIKSKHPEESVLEPIVSFLLCHSLLSRIYSELFQYDECFILYSFIIVVSEVCSSSHCHLNFIHL